MTSVLVYVCVSFFVAPPNISHDQMLATSQGVVVHPAENNQQVFDRDPQDLQRVYEPTPQAVQVFANPAQAFQAGQLGFRQAPALQATQVFANPAQAFQAGQVDFRQAPTLQATQVFVNPNQGFQAGQVGFRQAPRLQAANVFVNPYQGLQERQVGYRQASQPWGSHGTNASQQVTVVPMAGCQQGGLYRTPGPRQTLFHQREVHQQDIVEQIPIRQPTARASQEGAAPNVSSSQGTRRPRQTNRPVSQQGGNTQQPGVRSVSPQEPSDPPYVPPVPKKSKYVCSV